MRYKISEFSRLCQVSAKILRYYDDVGLLKPDYIDPMTAYRYYEIDQLHRLNRILALKDLGFQLGQITEIIDQGVSVEEMRGMLRLKQAEARQEMDDAQVRLDRIEARLRQIEQEGHLPAYEIVLKSVMSAPVVSIRAILSTPADQYVLWDELHHYLQTRSILPTGAYVTIYHDLEYKDSDWDIEVCCPVSTRAEETENVKFQTLPEVPLLASTIHRDPVAEIPLAYQALIEWIGRNGYSICGPARDVSWQTQAKREFTAHSTVIESQFPIEKISPIHP
jgi:DNA-binding transcriptional MerR regulator